MLNQQSPNNNRNLGERICKYCGRTFIATTPNRKYCSPYCLGKVYSQIYTGDWSRQKANQKAIRAYINTIWGIVNPLAWKTLWKLAESIAPHILEREDFIDVKLLTTEFQYSPFDIITKRNDSLCVIQVTTATTQPGYYKSLRLAQEFRLVYYVLYVRPDLKAYILKNSQNPGAYKIYLNEVLHNVKPVPEVRES
jgi:hypothetical protein